MKGKASGLSLSVDVLKCDAAELGALMMYIHSSPAEERLVAVAHSIGHEQIPGSKQVQRN